MNATTVSCYKDSRNALGKVVLVVVGGGFIYFTLAVIVVPLLQEDTSKALDSSPLFFIDRFYLLSIPTVAGILMAMLVSCTLGIVLISGSWLAGDGGGRRMKDQ
jgi:hypothetical protein